MKPKKKKILIIVAILALVGVLAGGGIGLYMFNMPHLDVQNSEANYSLTTTELVDEYLSNALTANEKYLSEDGNSKILEITGTVAKISENYDGQKVVLLKEETDMAGVRCVFLDETSVNASDLKVGEKTTIKGIIISGAAYDEDLELFEHVILDKSDVIHKIIKYNKSN